MKTIAKSKRFLLATIAPQTQTDQEIVRDMRELKELVDTYGGIAIDFVVQKREIHDKGMYLGRGKIAEVAEIVAKEHIDVVVLNASVKPDHLFVIQTMLRKSNFTIQVWDRVDLILHIFADHAHTAEAKLQIELASMRHMGPRIYGMGMVMSRQGGGIGTLGVGETNTELMKRHWQTQMKKVQEKIQKHSQDRERQLGRRRRNGISTVSLIGYTNAGKTSLFNALTNKNNTVQNALFVTLDSSTGKVFLPKSKKEILLSDTIGFIQNLPTTLIDAFKSTLLEVMHADLLLFVIDFSDDEREQKIRVVEGILRELGLRHKKRIYIFNKMDRVLDGSREDMLRAYEIFNPQFISVKKKEGVEHMLSAVEDSLSQREQITPDAPRRRKVIHLEEF